jgi:hypothetical protein
MTNMAVITLTREAILAATDLPKELIDVPEWGGSVWVRGLTGAERDRFENSVIEQKGRDRSLNLRNVRAKLCALCMVDEEGKRLFADSDIQALGQKSAAALSRVFDAAQRLSGLTREDVKELAENLDDAQSDGSTLDSL